MCAVAHHVPPAPPGRALLMGFGQEDARRGQVAAHPDAGWAEHCAGWVTGHGIRLADRRSAVGSLGSTQRKRPIADEWNESARVDWRLGRSRRTPPMPSSFLRWSRVRG